KDIVRKVLVFTPRSLQPAEVYLLDILKDTQALVSYRLEKSGIELLLQVEPKDLKVFCEPGEFRQVFLNLILNAIDAMETKGKHIVIRGRSVLGENKICVEVEDEGCGMHPDELSHAFDLFYSTKEVGKGTGLGLSVAQNIVMNHGGIIEAESVQGQGTTIRVIIPIR
ncbi:MAG: hypothetical protein KJ645_00660, partial [Planctomycetes bacterium]|nr:hypothetical protein [Planctomycetota bacterium]